MSACVHTRTQCVTHARAHSSIHMRVPGHQLGVGAVVVNEKRHILMVQEAHGPLKGKGVWKASSSWLVVAAAAAEFPQISASSTSCAHLTHETTHPPPTSHHWFRF